MNRSSSLTENDEKFQRLLERLEKQKRVVEELIAHQEKQRDESNRVQMELQCVKGQNLLLFEKQTKQNEISEFQKEQQIRIEKDICTMKSKVGEWFSVFEKRLQNLHSEFEKLSNRFTEKANDNRTCIKQFKILTDKLDDLKEDVTLKSSFLVEIEGFSEPKFTTAVLLVNSSGVNAFGLLWSTSMVFFKNKSANC
eukprot:TRINITY_DN3738_c0_g1_i1.p1 TRINITY_DN3738_c0_g1~~TRINITY_DN3738_c0_g1_i1.p1  ORF type:complete len:196 (+),score=26.48 TRINITY_DN3738_c0_g1_i1:97-684(+)